jgi:hypothetical protein
MGKKITEDYVKEKDCKHSVRYRTRSNTCSLKDMAIYVPRTVLGDKPPHSITLTLELPDE